MTMHIGPRGYTDIRSEQVSIETQYYEFSINTFNKNELVGVSLGYRRGFEFDEKNQPGQDFAVVRGDEKYIVAVVADGVSH